MKGITPVIAVILLLLITVAMVGFAFVWFGRVTEQAQNATEQELQNTIRQAQRVSIDSYGVNQATIRAIGGQNVPVSSISVTLNGTAVNCGWSGTIASGSFQTCNLAGGCTPSTVLKVTAPGNSDEVTC